MNIIHKSKIPTRIQMYASSSFTNSIHVEYIFKRKFRFKDSSVLNKITTKCNFTCVDPTDEIYKHHLL